jgi:hypothetical protein
MLSTLQPGPPQNVARADQPRETLVVEMPGRTKVTLHLLEPWTSVGLHGEQCERELALECGPRHSLHGRKMRAIATRQDCDDVLFVSTDDPFIVAVVHLTYANKPEPDPRWPGTAFFASLDDWLERGMKPDHEDFTT